MTNFPHLPAELDFLKACANEGAALGNLVEIGSDDGSGSTKHLGEIAKRHGRLLYCVDTFCDHPGMNTEAWRNVRTEVILSHFAQNIAAAGLWDCIRLLRMPSAEAIRVAMDVGFVFLDGSHSAPWVGEDFRLWPDIVLRGGVVAAHDACSGPVGAAIAAWQARDGAAWERIGCADITEAWRRKRE